MPTPVLPAARPRPRAANGHLRGWKRYEFAVVSDKHLSQDVDANNKVDFYFADVISAQDYWPFGSVIAERQFVANGAGDYRYGFNGKEQDCDFGKQYDYGARIYNAQIGRWLSVDPLTREYSMLTPYQFASNTPIQAIDLDGLEATGVQNSQNVGVTTAISGGQQQQQQQQPMIRVLVAAYVNAGELSSHISDFRSLNGVPPRIDNDPTRAFTGPGISIVAREESSSMTFNRFVGIVSQGVAVSRDPNGNQLPPYQLVIAPSHGSPTTTANGQITSGNVGDMQQLANNTLAPGGTFVLYSCKTGDFSTPSTIGSEVAAAVFVNNPTATVYAPDLYVNPGSQNSVDDNIAGTNLQNSNIWAGNPITGSPVPGLGNLATRVTGWTRYRSGKNGTVEATRIQSISFSYPGGVIEGAPVPQQTQSQRKLP